MPREPANARALDRDLIQSCRPDEPQRSIGRLKIVLTASCFMKSPRKRLVDMVKDKETEIPVSEPGSSKNEKEAAKAPSSVTSTSSSSKKKKKKASKKPRRDSSSESDQSEWEEESNALLDLRFEDLGTQDRAKIRSFKNFYINLPGLFKKIDKDGAKAFMETFDTLKDFDVDFRDMRESNSQYDVIFETFAKVFEDLLYIISPFQSAGSVGLLLADHFSTGPSRKVLGRDRSRRAKALVKMCRDVQGYAWKASGSSLANWKPFSKKPKRAPRRDGRKPSGKGSGSRF